MTPKVVIAEKIAEAGIEALGRVCTVESAVGCPREELLVMLEDASAIVVRSATQVDREMIEAAPHLSVIGRAGIGVDNIDLEAASEHGVLVVNAPHANTISAAEHAMALMLSQARNIPRAHATTVGGTWDRKSFQGVELHGKTLGVVGLGRIGTLVAQRALAFGMTVIAYDPFVTAERARRIGVEITPLEALIETADFVTIHLPKTKETQGLFGKELLARAKPGIRIVNTSRGGIIDELALADVIASGRVAGAALDVFAIEPLTESPLFDLEGVVVTPHLGASTLEAQDKAGSDVAEAVAAALRGELVPSAVNIDLGPAVSDDVREYLPVADLLGRAFVGVSRGLPDRIVVRVEGRIAAHGLRPLKLGVLKGALSGVSSRQVTFVNAPALAAAHGVVADLQSSEDTVEYVSLLGVSGVVGDREFSLAATMGRKGPLLVEIDDHEVELPFSSHMLVIRNSDTPGMIGRVGAFLGDCGLNIANMAVGRSSITGEAAMMGISLDSAMSDEQVSALREIDGIEEARFLDLD